MQKRKVDGEWVTEMTKPEVKMLMKARVVLQDLAELDASAEAAESALSSVIGDIDEAGQYVPPPQQETAT